MPSWRRLRPCGDRFTSDTWRSPRNRSADIRDLGGVVFFLAMNDMSKNFDSDRNREILQLLMLVDQQLVDAGHSIYAVAIARKG
jgi:hypothetical protein